MMPEADKNLAFDPRWEDRYAAGHRENYPWDVVVSFVFRHAPRDRPRDKITIVEAGCGTGSNLWFAAREGFSTIGLEGSAAAVEMARERFAKEGLPGKFETADFTKHWPLDDESVDLVIDRGSLTCVPCTLARKGLKEAKRILRPGGKMLFNPYSQAHGSYLGSKVAEDGFVTDIKVGTMASVGQLCFWDRAMVDKAVSQWTVLQTRHMAEKDSGDNSTSEGTHAEWRVTLEKPA